MAKFFKNLTITLLLVAVGFSVGCSTMKKAGKATVDGAKATGKFLGVNKLGKYIARKNVRAFERQYLSADGMEFIGNALEEESVQHMLNAREGSVGGFGGAGGGCGCN